MSRVAKKPIHFDNVQVSLESGQVAIKGAMGSLVVKQPKLVNIELKGNLLQVSPLDKTTRAKILAGTTRANLANAIIGSVQGFEKKLQLVGVGYRVSLENKKLNLSIGYPQPVVYEVPEGISITIPTPTEIYIKGINKQLVGQVAAEIRAYRPPEPYKGKGIRYADELIKLKETKKK